MRVKITYLKANEASTKVFSKYTDLVNIFLSKLAIALLKHIRINNHIIKLVDNQKAPYSPIYSIRLVELK